MVDFRRLVKELDLEMKPVGVEYLFGGEKAVFYFAAEERVDFRQLVKDLSSTLHIRVDMRQMADSLNPSRFAWQKSRTCRSTRPRSAAFAAA